MEEQNDVRFWISGLARFSAVSSVPEAEDQ